MLGGRASLTEVMNITIDNRLSALGVKNTPANVTGLSISLLSVGGIKVGFVL